MAAEPIVLTVDIDGEESIKTLNTLESELDDLKKQIKGVEIGSKAFKDLSNQIRKSESAVKNLNKSFEGMDTDQLTGEFGKLAGGITSAFTGIAVLSDDANESMEAMIQTVAKGMAIAQGFKGATEAMTAAQRVYNAVLKANPIGLIITAIGILIGLVVAFINYGDQVIETLDGWAKKFTFLEGPIKVIKMGIQGLIDLWDKAKRLILGDTAVDRAIADKKAAILKGSQTEAEQILATQQKLHEDRLKAERKSLTEILAYSEDMLTKRLMLTKAVYGETSDEYKAMETQLIETQALANEEKLRLIQEKIDKEAKLLKDGQIKLKLIKEDAELDEEIDIEEDDDELPPEIQTQMDIFAWTKDLLEQTTEFKLEQLNIQQENLEENHKKKFISEKQYSAGLAKIEKDRADLSIKTEKTTAQTKLAIAATSLMAIGQILAISSDMEKKTAKEKQDMAITQAIINTAAGVLMAFSTNPPPSPIGFISAALVAALGAVQISKISQQTFASGGMITGPSHNSTSGGVPIMAEGGEAVVNANSMSNASLRNLASVANTAGGGVDFSTGDGSINLSSGSIAAIVGGINNKQVFVSETDITETQNRVAVIEEIATL